jgi:hypothetical protein
MNSMLAFRLVQGFYWLFLGAWFGALVMLVIAAAITFKTVRSYQPVITTAPYNDPGLNAPHADVLAGGVVGNVLRGLAVVQIVCALGVLLCIVLQCTAFADRLAGGLTGLPNLLRILLVAVPVLCLAIDVSIISPRVWHYRVQMYNPALSVEVRAAARQQFDVYHKLDERVVGTGMFALAAAILASAFVLHAAAAPQATGPASKPGVSTALPPLPPRPSSPAPPSTGSQPS